MAPARCQVGPYVIRGWQIGTETGFSRSTPGSLRKYGSTDAAHTLFYILSKLSKVTDCNVINPYRTNVENRVSS